MWSVWGRGGNPYIIGLDCHYKHNPTRHSNYEQSDYVENADDIQGNVSWTRQCSLGVEVEHFGGVLSDSEICSYGIC